MKKEWRILWEYYVIWTVEIVPIVYMSTNAALSNKSKFLANPGTFSHSRCPSYLLRVI